MSAEEKNEMDKALESKRRAEEMLGQVRAQQPEIKELSERAIWLIRQNNFSALIMQTVGPRT